MRWGWAVALVASVLLGSGCSVVRRSPPPVVDGVQTGIASWYGPGFHGNRTANGEIFDQYELTAAHPSLPLGTRVMVTNLANGRAVEVRINDRGPFVDNRVIDLSYGAARVIGMIGPGTSPVRIEILGAEPTMLASRSTPPLPRPTPVPRVIEPLEPRPVPPPRVETKSEPRSEPKLAAPASSFEVEVASFSDAGRAEHLRGVLASRFPDAHVRADEGATRAYYRVRIGPYPLRGVAVARAEVVNRLGYPAVIDEAPLR
jgi:peptidoglycan lytic transglycosylase